MILTILNNSEVYDYFTLVFWQYKRRHCLLPSLCTLMCLNPLLDPNIPSHNPCELKSTSATAESSQFFVNRQISNPFHFTPQKDDFYLPSYKIEFWRNDERWNFETTFISVPERQIYLLDTFFHNFDISFGGRTKIKSKIPKTFHFAPTHLN